MKFKLVFLFIIAGFVQCSYALTLSDPSILKIAVFDVNATPPVGSQLTYGQMKNSDDLSLRAKGIILIGAGKPIVLCAIDWIGIANESQDIFKDSLAKAAGTTPDRVVVHTLHQHDAPICDFTAEKILKRNNMSLYCFDGTFARRLIKDIQLSITSSLLNAQPITQIGLGKAVVYNVASNRRINKKDGKVGAMRGSSSADSVLRAMPEGLIDPEISLISFWNDNKPVAILSFFATHPQSYYLTNIANPDFVGIARYFRQLAVPDALHIHFNGAGGNIAAGKYNDGSHENRLILAERMADGMKRAWGSTQKYPIKAADVKWLTEPLLLPYNPKIADVEKNMREKGNEGYYISNSLSRFGWYVRRKEGKSIETSCLSMGNARLLFMPGELFVEYQLAAKNMAPDKFVAMAAYGDYGPSYIGTQEAYSEGGYEIEVSPVTSDAEKIIMNVIKTLLAKSDK